MLLFSSKSIKFVRFGEVFVLNSSTVPTRNIFVESYKKKSKLCNYKKKKPYYSNY